MRKRLITVGALAIFLILVVMAASTRGQIVDQGPTASFTYSPSAPMPGDIITFDASSSYAPSGTIVSYTWDFGDGAVATVASPTITHSYIIDGTYTVQLTVVDTNGAQDTASAIIDVSTVVFFRVVFSGTLIPISGAKVTAYVNSGSGWITAPVGPSGFEIKYDNMTQPNLATTSSQRFRNPGVTASTLRQGASNIGFDIHPSCWTVYFKIEWAQWTAYWPNETTKVYSYNNGAVETHNYGHDDGAYWDPTASRYVIRVEDIPQKGVSPTESHPIIVGILCPPPPQQYYLTVKTSPSGVTTIPGQGWYNQGTNVTLTAPTYVTVSSNTRYRFNYWDVDGTSQSTGVNPITVAVNANHTATAHYVTQYSVLFNQVGLSANATGAIVTVNGNPENYTQMPFTSWVDSGGSVTYSYSSIVSSSISGQQFRLSTVTGPSTPITVSGPMTVTGNYITQYQVTFAQTGLDSSANGAVVTVNGSAKVYTSLPYTLWVDCGSSVTYSYSSTASSSTSGKQFRLNTVSGHSSPFIVSGPMTVTGNYIAQYSVTFAQTGLDSTASGTIVTVNGSSQIFSTLPYTLWVDNGNSVTYVCGSTIPSSVSGKQFRLSSVTGTPSPVTVAGPTTITGNYKAQYYLTVTSPYDSPSPASGWFDSGSAITESVTSPAAGPSGTQYICKGWSGTGSVPASGTSSSVTFTISAPSAITWTWKTQYYLTVTSAYDSPNPVSGWFDSGTGINASVTSPTPGPSGIQYVCTGWSGSGSVPASGSGSSVTFTITAPSCIVWSWKTQYYLTVSSPYDSPTPLSGWFDSGTSITESVNSPVSGGSGTQYVYTGWSGTGSVPASGTASSVTFTITSPSTITWTWKTQYYLTVTSPYDSPSPASGWFDSGRSINESVTSPVSGGSGIQYVCTGWSGTGSVPASGTASSVTFTIGSASSISWTWKTQYYLTVSSPYDSPSPGSGWFDSGTGINASVTSPTPGGSGIQYACTGWSGTGSVPVSGTTSSVAFTITSPSTITWSWKTQYYLTVSSPYDSPTPSSGWFDSGKSITESVNSPVSGGSGIQYVCTGWSGSGSVPASGSGSSVTFTITAPSCIVWSWKTQYYLTVSSPYDSPTPLSGWFDSGTGITELVSSPVSGGSGIQYVCTGWSGTGSVPASGTASSVTFNINAPSSIVWSWKTQYYLTVSSPYDSPTPLSGWFDSGTGMNESVTSPTPGPSGTQYVCTGWSGSGSVPSSGTASSVSFTIAQPSGITWNWKTQYYLTVTSPHDSPSPVSGWFDSGTSINESVTSPVSGGSGLQYVCTGWSGTGSVPASGTASSVTFTIGSPSSISWTWKTQYQVTFGQSGVGLDFLGTVVSVDSVNYNVGSLTVSYWWDSGSSHSFSFASPLVVGSKQYSWNSTSGLSTLQNGTLTIAASGSVVGNYVIQNQITVDQVGVSSDFTGTVVIIDSTSYSKAQLPVSFLWSIGSTHNFAFQSPLIVGASTKQYVWTSTTGLSSLQSGSITVAAYGSIIGNYKTQYYLTVSSPYDSPTPSSGWFDSGSNVTDSVTSPVSGGSGTQYVCTGWSGSGSVPASGTGTSVTFAISAPSAITWTWKTQYYLTVSSPYDSPSPVSGWFDSGSNVTDSVTSPVSGGSGTQYVCRGWSGSGSVPASGTASSVTFAITSPSTITWTWKTQYYLTVTSAYDSPNPVSGWFDSGTGINASVTSPTPGPSGIQYVCTGWSGSGSVPASGSGSSVTFTITAPSCIVWSWKTQYYLTVTSPYDSPSPLSGWFDSGTSITELVTSPTPGPSGTQYVCTGWSGSGSVPASGITSSVTFTITSPSTITWTWKTQYYLTVTSAYDSPNPSSGWFDSGTGINASVTSPTPGPSGIQYVCTGWSGSGSVPASGSGSSVTFTITAPSTITWTWKTQYYLTVTSAYDSPNPSSGWFDSGTNVTDLVTSPVSGGSGTQYVCTGWSGTGSVPVSGIGSSVAFTINAPSSIVWSWKTQYYLTVSSPYDSPSPVSGWFDSGSNVTDSVTSPVSGGSGTQYVCRGWSGSGSVPASGTGTSVTFAISAPSAITWTWKTQYYLTVSSAYGSPSGQGWYDAGSTANFSVTTPVSGGVGTQYVFTVWSSGDPGGYTGSSASQSVTMNDPITETAIWKTQYYLTVSSPYDSPTPLSGWFDSGTGITELVSSPVSGGSGIQYVCTGWTGTGSVPASGTASSVTFTITQTSNVTWIWKTQYIVTFDHSGLDSSSSGTVVTVNGTPITYGQLPYILWADSGDSIAYSYNNVPSSTSGKTFVLIGVTGLPSPITVASPMTVTGNYKTQYQVTFNQAGVGSDFSGAIVRIDGTDYNYGSLPSSFWWDNGSSHTFSFYSPLVVNISKQYNWASTSGLSTLKIDTISVTGTGSVTGNYAVQNKYQITFNQTGVNTDFTGTVVAVDGVNYTVGSLPASFWWDSNSFHTFAYQSPLIVTPNGQQYVWISSSGLSTLQSDTIMVTTSGSITGNYKTQYYLTLITNPPGVNSPSGAGWYDANTNATVFTTAFVDIVPGCSRYRFNGWTTADMTEIADPTRSPTNVTMDEAKIVTANYVAQYVVAFKQTAVGSDFTGTVVAIDSINYNITNLPATFFWDNGTTHSFDFKSPLIVISNAKQYVWASTSGLSTQQSGFIVVMSCGNITGNYGTQYYLTVATSPPGIATIPGEGWYNDSASVMLTAPAVSNYSFAYWLVNGVSQGPGVNPITLTMNIAKNATAQYTPITPYMLRIITTSGGTTNPSPGTYTYSSGTTVHVTALPNSGYILAHWELDSTNVSSTINPIPVVMNMNHTLIAVFSIAPSPPSVTISPLDSTVAVGGSVLFTSSVSGGTAPYSYQWYLDGAPVSGATSASWAFAPPSTGMYFVYLKVTDTNSASAVSSSAKVTVVQVPVGGYSVSLAKHTSPVQALAYSTLVCLFAMALIVVKRKRK